MNQVNAHWSGGYPTLCFGEWTLEIDGKNVSDKIPSDLINSPMNTAGTYSRWHFNKNWMEETDYYYDGLEVDDWIDANNDWLNNITKDYALKERIFYAIQEQDFRHGSCGGCI